MKILFVTISMDAERGGGTAERTRHLALTAARQGAACTVVALEGTSWRGELEAAGVRVWLTGKAGRRFSVPLANPFRLWREVASADAVHVMGYWYLLAAMACLVARLRGRPYLLNPAGEFSSIDRPRPVPRLFHVLLGRQMIAHAASLIAITGLEAQEFRDRFAIPPERLLVLSNGVGEPDPSLEAERDPLLPEGRFVLFMGRLAPIKGPDLLIEAFGAIAGKFPDVGLVLAGPDLGMRAGLERRAAELGISDRVRFLGFINEHMRVAAYRSALLLAIPSRSEAMSLVALEAGILGTPVLLTDRCGFAEVAESGGGLVVPADAGAIAAGLEAMLAQAESLPAMGERLRRLVRESHTWPAIAAKLRTHIEGLARRAGPTADSDPCQAD